MAAGDEVDVKMRDGLARVRAVVDHDAEASGEVEFLRDGAGGEEEVAEDGFVGRGGFADARYQLFGDDEKVGGRLRLDVVKDDAVFVLVLDLGGDFAIDDSLEDGFGHVGKQITTKHTKYTKS